MKTKIYTLLLVGVTFFVACTPDDYEIKDSVVDKAEVKMIKLTSDHQTLLPGTNNRMHFSVRAYGSKELSHKVYNEDDNTYTEEVRTETFLIPNDQLPKDFIKIVNENGEAVEGDVFSVSNNAVKSYTFYARTESLESEPLTIEVKEPFQPDYEEIVIPLVFHLLQPPASSGPAYNVSLEELQEKVDELNNVFNFRVSNNPNGASAKITFRLADYDPYGRLLDTKGKNLIQMSQGLTGNEYFNYINEHLLWDPTKYLNVWVAKYATYWTGDGSQSYQTMAPTVIAPGFAPIAGINATEVSDYGLEHVGDFKEIGILYEMTEFLNPRSSHTHNVLEFSTIMGEYFGLLPMAFKKHYDWRVGAYVNNLVDGDSDYCPDTYVYELTSPISIYKKSYEAEFEFTSFNIMCEYSRKNSITADQAKRIRAVLEACPSRWAYKSDWAFTGN